VGFLNAGGVRVMASQSLYRKWRSQTFDDLVGQEPIIRTLKNALKNDNLSHAYLFTGPRGTGKTSTARLLAKTVNCTNPHEGEPCNVCQQCREITAGNSFNVIEIDAASNRGIDSIRELREKVMVPPSTGKYKIYILDEAHMLTTEAFNALLKTLEEPPEYALFVMATTDVHKMLPTVLSRCQRFDFKRISTRQIVERLLFVAKEEKVELEKSAAELIARTAAGGMRDALSLLDQAIAYAGSAVSLAQVQAMLGVADPRAIAKLIGHIANLESPELLYLIHELSEAGADLRQINAQMVEYWRALMLAKAGADIAAIMDLTEDEVSEVKQLAPAFTLDELTECARIFAQNDLVQRNQGTPQLGLELASLESTEIHRRVQAGGSVKETVRTQETVAAPSRPSASSPSSRSSASSPSSSITHEPTARPARTPEPSPARQYTSFMPHVVSPNKSQAISEEMATPLAPREARSGQSTLTLQQVAAAWENVKKRTMQRAKLLGTYVGMCDILGVEDGDGGSIIVIRAAKTGHFKAIKDGTKDIEWALETEFSTSCSLRVIPPDQAYSPSRVESSIDTSLPSTSFRPTSELLVEKPAKTSPTLTYQTEKPEPPARAQHVLAVSEASPGYNPDDAQPLARPQEVSENKKVILSKEELEQKVQQDPVVQVLLTTFGAKIVDIRQKQGDTSL
jgi:DNA polymerase III subunit gamma/tau